MQAFYYVQKSKGTLDAVANCKLIFQVKWFIITCYFSSTSVQLPLLIIKLGLFPTRLLNELPPKNGVWDRAQIIVFSSITRLYHSLRTPFIVSFDFQSLDRIFEYYTFVSLASYPVHRILRLPITRSYFRILHFHTIGFVSPLSYPSTSDHSLVFSIITRSYHWLRTPFIISFDFRSLDAFIAPPSLIWWRRWWWEGRGGEAGIVGRLHRCN